VVSRRVALLLLIGLAGCGRHAPEPAPRRDSDRPRILSMNPCIDAILLRVADPGQIVSISHLSHDATASSLPIAWARRFPGNHGTAEDVLATRPDVVLIEPHSAPATQTAIRRLGIRIAPVPVPVTIAQSRAQITMIARIAGHADRGRALVARIDAALAAARAPAGSPRLPALIRMPDGLVPGAGTLADEMLAHAGFRNMSGDHGLMAWDILPLEPLLARPPRVLLTDRSRRMPRADLLARLPDTRIADLPDRLLQCAGPNLIAAAGRLAAIRRAEARS
jgi:iron complex transport system substrate-binding protein